MNQKKLILVSENFDFGNIVMNKKLYGNLLLYGISYKTLLVEKPLLVGSINLMDLLELIMRLDIQYYFDLKNSISSAIELDIFCNRNQNTCVSQGIKIDSCNSLPLEKTLTFRSCFSIKIKIISTIIYSQKNAHINKNRLYYDRIDIA